MKKYSQETNTIDASKEYDRLLGQDVQSVKQLAADYKKFLLSTGMLVSTVVVEMKSFKAFLSKAISPATNIAKGLWKIAFGEAVKKTGPVLSGATKAVLEGIFNKVNLVLVFAQGFQEGSKIAPYLFGDMSNYVTKCKRIGELLENNLDRDGEKTDPKIKELNDEMRKYQTSLITGSYGLAESGEKHSGTGMKILEAKTPPVTDAKATKEHVDKVLSAMKDLDSMYGTCKVLGSEEFKKKYYDVHYIQGNWANVFSQDLNQMQQMANSVVEETTSIMEKSADYISKVLVFGDQLISGVDDIFKQEEQIKQPTTQEVVKPAYIMNNFIIVANLLQKIRKL